MRILRRHLVEKVPVSDLCDEQGLHPTLFNRWQKEFFEKGAAAFERGKDCRERLLEKENNALKVKIAHKNEVIAEIMESHVGQKKVLGKTEQILGGTGQALWCGGLRTVLVRPDCRSGPSSGCVDWYRARLVLPVAAAILHGQ